MVIQFAFFAGCSAGTRCGARGGFICGKEGCAGRMRSPWSLTVGRIEFGENTMSGTLGNPAVE